MDSCVIFLPRPNGEIEDVVEPTIPPSCFDHLIKRLAPLFHEVLVSAVSGSHPKRCGVPVLMGPPRTGGGLAALHSALHACEGNPVFALSGDRPMVSIELIQYMRRLVGEFDVVIPRHEGRYYPMCAYYTRRCLRPIEAALELENRRIASFFEHIRVRCVDTDEIARFDPHVLSLRTIWTDAEYEAVAKEVEAARKKAAAPKRKRRKKKATKQK